MLNGTLGWAVTFKSLFMFHLDLQRFPGPVCGSWILPPPTLVFWGSISRMSVTMGSSSWLPSPSTAYCHLQLPGPRAWSFFPHGWVISGSPPLHLASVILGEASHLHHCGPGHHPSIIYFTSIILASGSSGL